MKKYQGRKALVLLTDGEDTASRGSIELAIASCQRFDTIAYAIGIGSGLSRGASFLEDISKKTGGRYFAVSKKEPVDVIYSNIEQELRSQYNIGYLPPPVPPEKGAEKGPEKAPAKGAAAKNHTGYHKVRVTVKRSGAIAHTREGYYGS
jgi:hypothetical protein